MNAIATVTAVGALAGAAHADFFFISTDGSFEVSGFSGDIVEGTVETNVQMQFGDFDFQAVTGEFSAELGDPATPGTFAGTYNLLGPSEADFVTIEITGQTDNGGEEFFSYAGLWEAVDTGGVFEGLVGSGDLSGSHFLEGDDGGFADVQVQGDLVPTPATVVLLATGGLVLTRRRR